MIEPYRIPLTTTAGGAASGSTPILNGKFHGLHVALGTATSVDVVVSVSFPATLNLFSEAGIVADTWRFPRQQVHGPTGTALTYDATHPVGEPYPVIGALTVTIATGGNAKTLAVTLFVDD